MRADRQTDRQTDKQTNTNRHADTILSTSTGVEVTNEHDDNDDDDDDVADMAAVVKNREEDAERLAEEVSENRDDLNRMLDSFRHRERQLLDDIDALTHKNATLSDLVDLVTERAESTQKELDRSRAGDVTADITNAPAPSTDVTLQKEWEVGNVSGAVLCGRGGAISLSALLQLPPNEMYIIYTFLLTIDVLGNKKYSWKLDWTKYFVCELPPSEGAVPYCPQNGNVRTVPVTF